MMTVERLFVKIFLKAFDTKMWKNLFRSLTFIKENVAEYYLFSIRMHSWATFHLIF